MSHDIAALSDGTAGGTTLSVAQHTVITLGSIMNPSIEVAQHTGVDGTEEIKEVFREIPVARIVFRLIPVNQVLRHPHLFAFCCKILVGRLNATILMTAINVKTIKHISLVQGIGIAVADGQCLWGHHLGTDGSAIGLYELCNLRGIPQTSGIGCRPIGLVLDGDGIKLDTVSAHVLHIVFQVLCIVGPVLALQLTRRSVLVLSIASAVGLPLCRLSPG